MTKSMKSGAMKSDKLGRRHFMVVNFIKSVTELIVLARLTEKEKSLNEECRNKGLRISFSDCREHRRGAVRRAILDQPSCSATNCGQCADPARASREDEGLPY